MVWNREKTFEIAFVRKLCKLYGQRGKGQYRQWGHQYSGDNSNLVLINFEVDLRQEMVSGLLKTTPCVIENNY